MVWTNFCRVATLFRLESKQLPKKSSLPGTQHVPQPVCPQFNTTPTSLEAKIVPSPQSKPPTLHKLAQPIQKKKDAKSAAAAPGSGLSMQQGSGGGSQRPVPSTASHTKDSAGGAQARPKFAQPSLPQERQMSVSSSAGSDSDSQYSDSAQSVKEQMRQLGAELNEVSKLFEEMEMKFS